MYVILFLLLFISPSWAKTIDGHQVSYDCTKQDTASSQTVKVVFNNLNSAKNYANQHRAQVTQVGSHAWAVEYEVEEVESYLFDGLQCQTSM
jgi:hypothetical protein